MGLLLYFGLRNVRRIKMPHCQLGGRSKTFVAVVVLVEDCAMAAIRAMLRVSWIDLNSRTHLKTRCHDRDYPRTPVDSNFALLSFCFPLNPNHTLHPQLPLSPKSRALAPVTPLSRSMHSSRVVAGGHATSQHQHTDDNNSQTFFDFTEENYKLVENILGKYPGNYKQVRVRSSAYTTALCRAL